MRTPSLRRALLVPLSVAALLSVASVSPADPIAERVVVLVFDGVPERVLDGVDTPAFDRLRHEGAYTHHLEPPFPSISLIGGFTLSTGCWPSQHGIISNKFLDPERGLYDHSTDADWLIGCQGLHEVAEAAGLRAATLSWYGGASTERGPLASTVVDRARWKAMGDDPTRAEWVAEQVARTDANAPRLILAYFQGPDWAEHMHGIDADETREAVRDMDTSVARVMRAIEEGPAPRSTTLFVTTDHGMIALDTLVNAERLMHWHDVPARAVSTGTTSLLYFDRDAPTGAVDAAAQALSAYPDAFEVLRRDDLPAYARLGTGPRVPALILSAKPGHFIEDRDMFPPGLRWLGRFGPRIARVGAFISASHGYPPSMPEMHGVLFAWGAGVAAGKEIEHLRAIDLHPTVTHWLGISPGDQASGVVAPLSPRDR